MVTIQLEDNTFAVLLSGLYCGNHSVDARAVPHQIWLDLAKKVSEHLDEWDYSKLSFEDFIDTRLFIYPLGGLSDEDKEHLMNYTEYWIDRSGNVEIIVSIDWSWM